jgi:hyperosmotically inducible protein
MKTLILSTFVALGTAGVMVAIANATDSDNSTVGAYVQDSAVTTKVKAKLAEKHLSTLASVSVETDKDGVVWLSGSAPTKDAKDLAEMITKATDGVTAVHNDIQIQ